MAPRRLLVSIHDVGPRFEREVDSLLARLAAHIDVAHLAMLIVPDHWGAAPIDGNLAFQARLRGWSDAQCPPGRASR